MKTRDGHKNPSKNDENDQALVSNEMTLSSIGNDILLVTQQPQAT